MKTRTTIEMLVAFLILSCPCYAASDNDTPEPTPTSVKAAETSDKSMPLALYRKLRDALGIGDDAHPDLTVLAALIVENQDQVVAALDSTSALQRQLAARVAGFITNKTLVMKPLCARLTADDDSGVRAACAISLARLNDAGSVEALLKGLEDSESEVRAGCALALGGMRDERALPGLMNVLRSDDKPANRIQAAAALAQIGSKDAEKEMAALLDEEKDPRVRMAIAAALRVIAGDKMPAPQLPDPDEFSGKLKTLSDDMKDVEGRLRDDRTDQTVQLDQKGIEKRLDDMIKQLQDIDPQNMKPSKCDSKRRPLASVESSQPSSSSKGGQPPPRGPDSPGGGGGDASQVAVRRETWASLPSKERDELLQVFRPEVPLRWRKRLEAYFVSIAGEENRKEPKAAK